MLYQRLVFFAESLRVGKLIQRFYLLKPMKASEVLTALVEVLSTLKATKKSDKSGELTLPGSGQS